MRSPVEIGHFRTYRTGRRKLPITVPSQVRMVQVSSPAALFEGAHYFSQAQLTELQNYEPQILLGSTEDLLNLAERVGKGSLNLSKLDRAVFVLTDCRAVPLRDRQRVTFWQTFGVPVYELLLGGNGVLLAAECEAYEGWHIADDITFSSVGGQLWYSTRRGYSGGTGLIGEVQTQPCPCGRTGKRLVNVAMDLEDAVRHRLSA
ncbi:MAG: hypothetical protein JOY85_09010 [Acidobacteriaceae bacterium]|nr:hypothetical protein [Acidobacteriaceae bacterium]